MGPLMLKVEPTKQNSSPTVQALIEEGIILLLSGVYQETDKEGTLPKAGTWRRKRASRKPSAIFDLCEPRNP